MFRVKSSSVATSTALGRVGCVGAVGDCPAPPKPPAAKVYPPAGHWTPKPPAAREPEGRTNGQRGGGAKKGRGGWAGLASGAGRAGLNQNQHGRYCKAVAKWGARGQRPDPSGQWFKGWLFRRPRGTRLKNNEQHRQRPTFEHRTNGAGLHESVLNRYGNKHYLDH